MGERFFSSGKMARCALVVAISLSISGFSEQAFATPKEALMLRRITEYWKDGDYGTVKRQIVSFLEKNPDTALYDHLNAMLGDLYFQERNFRQALATYDLIANPEIREKTFFNHLQAQFEMRDYLTVIESAERFLKEHRNREAPMQVKIRYLLGESYFRHALKCGDIADKTHYLKMAKPHYKMLSQTKYSERVLFPLAEIHRLLREDDRAAGLYLNLAEKYPEHRERFLFQAGILQINQDKEEAIKTFYKVHEMGGKRSRLAAFNRLILLYQNESYEEFLAYYNDVISLMPEQKVPLLEFYEGRSFYALGDYQQAVMPLENYVTKAKGRSKELKTAHLLLVNCSRYLKDISLLERTMYSYKSTFPKDAEVPKVLMIHSQMCRENGNYTQALNDLKMLTTDYPAYEDAEAVLYDYGLLLSQMDRWIEAREMFCTFLDRYPHSERKSGAWRHLLNCCIEEIKNPTQENSDLTKRTFVEILTGALEQDHVLSDREKKQYQIALMKCRCELGEYDRVMPMLSQYLHDTYESEFLAEGHLLMALCHQKSNADLTPFIQHAEKALSHNPKLSDHDILHLELYNAYLTKGMHAEDEGNRNYFFIQAADHLFASEAWKERAIKWENHLWLANHFYHLALDGKVDDIKKAQALFSDLLGFDKETKVLNISSDNLHLEKEVLKYAHLLEVNKEQKEQIALLEALVKKQEEHAGLPWKLKRRAVLELAKAYEKDGQIQHALNSFRFLVKSSGKISSMVASTAQLHLAKLEYQLLKPQQRVSENPEMISILHTLKDLQIQKKLRCEPIHLEAALQYAEIREALADDHQEGKNGLFFYKRMMEDFDGVGDPISEEYNRLRDENPEKGGIVNAYMHYLDAQMLLCQAKMARKEKKLDKALQFEEEALQTLNTLLTYEEYLQPYLYDRVLRAKREAELKI